MCFMGHKICNGNGHGGAHVRAVFVEKWAAQSRISLAEISLSEPIRKVDDEHRQDYNIYTAYIIFFFAARLIKIHRSKATLLHRRLFYHQGLLRKLKKVADAAMM